MLGAALRRLREWSEKWVWLSELKAGERRLRKRRLSKYYRDRSERRNDDLISLPESCSDFLDLVLQANCVTARECHIGTCSKRLVLS